MMKITIESTTKTVKIGEVDCRVWEGKTEQGVRLVAFISGIMARKGEDVSLFESERKQLRAPSGEAAGLPDRLSPPAPQRQGRVETCEARERHSPQTNS
jgi:hypothetical protein